MAQMSKLAFELPVHSRLKRFAKYIKNNYAAQTAYYQKIGTIEVCVDSIYKNAVINTALAYGYTLLQE